MRDASYRRWFSMEYLLTFSTHEPYKKKVQQIEINIESEDDSRQKSNRHTEKETS